jgi:Cu-Zn family superoxide dismutase
VLSRVRTALVAGAALTLLGSVGASTAGANPLPAHQVIFSEGFFGSDPAGPVLQGAKPGGAPWVLQDSNVTVRRDGSFDLTVHRFVIPTAPFRGTNPVPSMSASLFCGDTLIGTSAATPLSTPDGNATFSGDFGTPTPGCKALVLLHPATNTAAYIGFARAEQRGRGVFFSEEFAGSDPAGPVFAGAKPGGAPWVLQDSNVSVRVDGSFDLTVHRFVIPTAPFSGTNPVPSMSATLFCGQRKIGTSAVTPLSTPDGNATFSGNFGTPTPFCRATVLLNPATNTAAYIGVTQPANLKPSRYLLAGPSVFPEGIAEGRDGHSFFTGSSNNGTIFKGTTASPATSTFLPAGSDGRTAATGMKVDARNRLIIDGAATGTVFVYDAAGGALLHRFSTGRTNDFLNDVAIAPNGDVFVTDSLQPFLYRIPERALDRDAPMDAALPVFKQFAPDEIVFEAGFNLNGLVVTPEGRFVLTADTNSGLLYRIDLVTKKVTKIDLGGVVVGGDGLLLFGHELLVVDANNPPGNAVVRIDLARDFASGTVVSRTTDPSLRTPTTMASDSGQLLVVNSQFAARNTGQAPALPFDVVRIDRP